jgi:hypothetical protein
MHQTTPLSKSTSGSSGCLVFILFAVVLGGSFGCYLFWNSYTAHQNFLTWQTVPIQITSNEIVRSPTSESDTAPYKLSIAYSYTAGGKQRESTNVSSDGNAYSDYQMAWKDSLEIDSKSQAWLNPEEPGKPVVLSSSPPSWWLLALPAFVALAGAYGLIGVLNSRSKKTKSTAEVLKAGRQVARRIGFVLVAVGIGLGTILARPMLRHFSSRSWIETPCTVLASSILHHTASDSTTYSTDVFYEYMINGQTFRSSRLNFDTGSSSNRAYYEELLTSYPARSNAVAYVNPEDPSDATLRRDAGSTWLLFLLPGVFLLIGGGLLFIPDQNAAALGGTPLSSRTAGTSLQVPNFVSPRKTRIGSFIGLLLMTLFWNGMTGFFIAMILQSSSKGPLWFMSIFALVGVGLIIAVFNKFLSIFSPALLIRTATNPIRVGSPLAIDWKIDGKKEKLEGASITLTAEASATYRRGTDSVTSKRTYLSIEQEIPATTLRQGFGSLRLEIPDRLMPSFIGSNNRFEWKLSAALKIARWPDSNDDYPLTVYPPAN